MPKFKNILLIDDDEITNYINADLIRSLDITENITFAINGKEALDYLQKAHQQPAPLNYTIPDLIFLDINMPVMNGFEFLENYCYLVTGKKNTTVVTMLTTSLIREEVAHALNLVPLVKGYIEKPLTRESVIEIYNYYLNIPSEEPKSKSQGLFHL